MAKAVRWTPKAIATYIDVLSYLREKWTAREEQRFVDEVEDTIRYMISSRPVVTALRLCSALMA